MKIKTTAKMIAEFLRIFSLVLFGFSLIVAVAGLETIAGLSGLGLLGV